MMKHGLFNASKLFYVVLVLGLVAFGRPVSLQAESFQEFGSSSSSGDFFSDSWKVHGYLESENYVYVDRNSNDKNRDDFNKVEEHVFLESEYGKEDVYLMGKFHGYAYPTDKMEDGNDSRVQVHELYLNHSSNYLDFRIGRQVLRWGSADTLNPTSYFTPLDFREMFLKEEDEFYLASDALDFKYHYKDFTLELVAVPIPAASRLPDENSDWAFGFEDVNGFPVRYEHDSLNQNSTFGNMSYGAKFTGYLHGLDFSLSAYHGLDNDVFLLPEPEYNNLNILSGFKAVPKYVDYNAFGLNLAFPVGRFTLYTENVYSPDKTGVTKGNPSSGQLPDTVKTEFINSVAGMNWLMDGESLRLIMEYHQSHYLNEKEDLFDPFVNDTLAVSLENRFWNRTLTTEFQYLYNIKEHSALLMPRVEYKFKSGFSLEAEGAIFEGDSDSLLGSYDANDLISLKAKLNF